MKTAFDGVRLRTALDPARVTCVFAFGLAISISLAEPLLFLAVAGWVVLEGRGGLRRAMQSPFFLPVALFTLVVVASVAWGVDPIRSARRLHRLIFALLLFAMGDLFSRPGRSIWPPVAAYCGGVTTLAFYDLFRIPALVSRGVAWPDVGNMRDPQLYLVAICLLIGMFFVRAISRWRPFLVLSLLPIAAALVLHLKRGVWIALFFALLLFAALSRRWRVLVLLALGVAAAFALPQVRSRAVAARELLTPHEGGRYLLWTEVAPALVRDHPLGMGWCAPRHEDLLAYSPNVQPGLRHLHNNVLQLLAELGWLGLAVWLGWMGTAVVTGWRVVRRHGATDPRHWLGLGVFCGFCGLLANGMVEYNFGDSEILMLYALLFGCMEALRRSPAAPEGGFS